VPNDPARQPECSRGPGREPSGPADPVRRAPVALLPGTTRVGAGQEGVLHDRRVMTVQLDRVAGTPLDDESHSVRRIQFPEHLGYVTYEQTLSPGCLRNQVHRNHSPHIAGSERRPRIASRHIHQCTAGTHGVNLTNNCRTIPKQSPFGDPRRKPLLIDSGPDDGPAGTGSPTARAELRPGTLPWVPRGPDAPAARRPRCPHPRPPPGRTTSRLRSAPWRPRPVDDRSEG